MKFNYYLDAWLHCTKEGIALSRIKKLNFHEYEVAPPSNEMGNL